MTEQLEADLASLRARAETLRSRHTAAEAAFADADAKLQRHLLEGDIDADDRVRAKLEAALASSVLTRDNFAKALAAQQAKITDAEGQLAAERAAAERKAASEALARNLDAVEKALPVYLDAARGLAVSLEAVHFHYEATELSRFIGNCASQAEIAAAFSLQELRGMVNGIANGSVPAPPKPQTAAPIATPEPAPPTQVVFMIKSARFRDHENRKTFAGQYTDAIMPVTVAEKAKRLGVAVPVTDARRATSLGSRGGDYRSDAVDVVDIDEAVEHSGVPYVGPDSVIQQKVNFIERRGPERKIAFEVQRVL